MAARPITFAAERQLLVCRFLQRSFTPYFRARIPPNSEIRSYFRLSRLHFPVPPLRFCALYTQTPPRVLIRAMATLSASSSSAPSATAAPKRMSSLEALAGPKERKSNAASATAAGGSGTNSRRNSGSGSGAQDNDALTLTAATAGATLTPTAVTPELQAAIQSAVRASAAETEAKLLNAIQSLPRKRLSTPARPKAAAKSAAGRGAQELERPGMIGQIQSALGSPTLNHEREYSSDPDDSDDDRDRDAYHAAADQELADRLAVAQHNAQRVARASGRAAAALQPVPSLASAAAAVGPVAIGRPPGAMLKPSAGPGALASGGGAHAGANSGAGGRVAPGMMLAAQQYGSMQGWVRQTNWKVIRNRHECDHLAQVVDALVAESVTTAYTGMELLCRRIAGVQLADHHSEWSLAEALAVGGGGGSLLSREDLRRALKDAAQLKRLNDSVSGGGGGGGKKGGRWNGGGGGANQNAADGNSGGQNNSGKRWGGNNHDGGAASGGGGGSGSGAGGGRAPFHHGKAHSSASGSSTAASTHTN